MAHNNRECLKELIESIQTFSKGDRIILFNGGEDKTFYEGLDVELCPYSKPLKHGKLSYFHYGIMKMLSEEKANYQFLVTLDSDMLLIKNGFSDFLKKNMQNSYYMGTNFQKIEKGTDWLIGKRFLYKWPGKFQQYFSIPEPYGSFNPCQVFGKEFVDLFISNPKVEVLMKKVEKSRLEALEEIIFATFAVKIKSNPVRNPGSHALVLRRHTLMELESYLKDENVYFVHKIGMKIDDQDRLYLRHVRTKGFSNITDTGVCVEYETSSKQAFGREMLTSLKDLYMRIFA